MLAPGYVCEKVLSLEVGEKARFLCGTSDDCIYAINF